MSRSMKSANGSKLYFLVSITSIGSIWLVFRQRMGCGKREIMKALARSTDVVLIEAPATGAREILDVSDAWAEFCRAEAQERWCPKSLASKNPLIAANDSKKIKACSYTRWPARGG